MKGRLPAAVASLSLATLSLAPRPYAEAPAVAQAVPSDAAMRATVDRLIARMTIEETAGQLSILGDDYGKVDDLARRGLLGGTNGVMPGHDVAVYTRHIQDMAMQSPLKIAVWFMGEYPHGYRSLKRVQL